MAFWAPPLAAAPASLGLDMGLESGLAMLAGVALRVPEAVGVLGLTAAGDGEGFLAAGLGASIAFLGAVRLPARGFEKALEFMEFLPPV